MVCFRCEASVGAQSPCNFFRIARLLPSWWHTKLKSSMYYATSGVLSDAGFGPDVPIRSSRFARRLLYRVQ